MGNELTPAQKRAHREAWAAFEGVEPTDEPADADVDADFYIPPAVCRRRAAIARRLGWACTCLVVIAIGACLSGILDNSARLPLLCLISGCVLSVGCWYAAAIYEEMAERDETPDETPESV